MNEGAYINLIIFLITSIINSALLAIVILKKCRHLKDPTCISFVFSIFFLLLWTLFNYLADTASDYNKALFFTRATIPSAFFMFWFIFNFSYLFPVKYQKGYKYSFIYLIFIFIFGILALTKLVILSIDIDPSIGITNIENSFLFIPIMILYLWIFIHSSYFFFKKFRELSGRKKEQIKYILLGWGLFLFGAIVVSGILPLVLGKANLSKLGPFFSIFMVGATTYAILRHRLLDIRIVIQRGLIYIVLFIMITIVYISGLQILGTILHNVTDTAVIFTAGATMIIGIIFFHPLENYFRKATDHIFFKDKYDYANALHELSKVLHTNVSKADIVKNSIDLLKKILKTNYVDFQFPNENSVLNPSWKAEFSTPIVFENKEIGLLELGKKLSGDKYTISDKKLLETFACQASVALEKGSLYQKVEEYNSHLEELVENRTEEIKRLQEDQKQAMIDISHNLQTPLSVIRGELELLGESSEEKEKMIVVKKSLERVSRFIRQLLHLSKLNHSAYNLEMSLVDISKIIEDQVEYFEVMAEEKKIQLDAFIEKGLKINGNKKLLEELVTNLVVNAITYRKKSNQDKIAISLIKNKTNISLLVEDNGMGISGADLPEIFNRFYRGSRKSNTSGTGLGLAICKKIIEAHNGTISVTSTKGDKTVFLATFPKIK